MSGWVCPECGLDYDTILPPDAVVALRSYPRRYRELFAAAGRRREARRRDPPAARARRVVGASSTPRTWPTYSTTWPTSFKKLASGEYTTLDHGLDPDKRRSTASYNAMDREDVLAQVKACSREHGQRDRPMFPTTRGTRSAMFSFGERDLLTMARNAVHEGYHHLRDVQDVLSHVIGRPVDLPDDDEDD